MATVRLHCERCLTALAVNIARMSLIVPVVNEELAEAPYIPSELEFKCTNCCVVRQPVTDNDSMMLTQVGIHMEYDNVPAELFEPKPTGQPLTADDLLDLHEALENDHSI